MKSRQGPNLPATRPRTAPPPRPGRPREFDLDAALDAAQAVFWKFGYEGASLADLTAAMNISRPSLYAAFGSKQELFRRTMDRYTSQAAATFAGCDQKPTGREFLECYLRTLVDAATDCRHPGGCFLIQGAISCSASAEKLRKDLVQRRSAARETLRARFEQAAADRELSGSIDTAGLADFYATVAQGISLQAVNGVSRARLHEVVSHSLLAWPTAPTKQRPSRRR